MSLPTGPSLQPLLQVEGIRKAFPGVVALDGVDFQLLPGEVHGVLGENGAGKSTLMKILCGALPRDSGLILVGGRPVQLRNPREAQQLGIAIIHQEFNLIPHLSVAENVLLGREPCLLPGLIDSSCLRARVGRLLEQLELPIQPEDQVGRLSLAQQQMVEVAKALAVEARILIMDEPTSALTRREIETLFGLIRRLQKRGVGIIYISHRLEELFQVGDRVTILRDGKVVGTRPLTKTSAEELIQLMADRRLQEHYPRRRVVAGEELLRVESLSCGQVLPRIDLLLRRGEVLGLAGLLGSGRTALLQALFGVRRAEGGSLWVRGKRVQIRHPQQAIRLGIGYLTEDRQREGLVPLLPVRDNILLPNLDQVSRWGVLRAARERALASRWVRELQIRTPHLEQPVRFLSGGNQQKVVLAKWLARQADILLFDEPTRGVDVAGRMEIYEILNRLTERGAGVLLASSDLPELLGMSDRIAVLCRGRVVDEMSCQEASQERVLRAALGHGAEGSATAPV